MTTRGAIVTKGCYHLVIRGNRRQKVFVDEKDYSVYLSRLRKYKIRFRIRLYGFCLMPNHVHLIVEVDDQKSLSSFMQGLNRSYSGYFNIRHAAVGHLWQGRFTSRLIAKDSYFINCISYVETNPVRAGMAASADEYPWSSCRQRNFIIEGRSILDRIEI
jgi:putative transposase